MDRAEIRNLALLLGGVALLAVAWYFVADTMTEKTGSRNTPNPIASNPDVLAEAMAHFADHCAFCHANDGSGMTEIGRGLDPLPPDLRRPATRRKTDGELFYIIQNGIRLSGMPGFGKDGGHEADSWKLVHFIRHLPAISAEELERMKGMNPKSPAELRQEEEIRRFLEGADVPSTETNHTHH